METQVRENTVVLVPNENLTAARIEKIRDYFVSELKAHAPATSVELNVKGVEEIDSLGVNLIVGLYRQVTSESKTFAITGAGEKFFKVASFFKFQTLFAVNAEEDEK